MVGQYMKETPLDSNYIYLELKRLQSEALSASTDDPQLQLRLRAERAAFEGGFGALVESFAGEAAVAILNGVDRDEFICRQLSPYKRDACFEPWMRGQVKTAWDVASSVLASSH